MVALSLLGPFFAGGMCACSLCNLALDRTDRLPCASYCTETPGCTMLIEVVVGFAEQVLEPIEVVLPPSYPSFPEYRGPPPDPTIHQCSTGLLRSSFQVIQVRQDPHTEPRFHQPELADTLHRNTVSTTLQSASFHSSSTAPQVFGQKTLAIIVVDWCHKFEHRCDLEFVGLSVQVRQH